MPSPTRQTLQTLHLRKYPNRRYYDTTRSTHATLEQIHDLIRLGHDIRVTDSKTGEDITARVLAQIILEHDSPKLDIFPNDLLHKIIRSNEKLVQDFVEKYFNQALSAFLNSQKQFDEYLRHAIGLNPAFAAGPQLAHGMFGPFAQAMLAQHLAQSATAPPTEPAPAANAEAEELRKVVEELKQQVADLQRPQPAKPPRAAKAAPSRRAKASRKSH